MMLFGYPDVLLVSVLGGILISKKSLEVTVSFQWPEKTCQLTRICPLKEVTVDRTKIKINVVEKFIFQEQTTVT